MARLSRRMCFPCCLLLTLLLCFGSTVTPETTPSATITPVMLLLPQTKDMLTELGSVILATTQEQREKLAKEMKEVGKIVLDVSGLGEVELGHDLLAIEYETKTENIREYIPSVIEPSFGIGRILFALCEHTFWTRAVEGGDEARGVGLIIYFPNL